LYEQDSKIAASGSLAASGALAATTDKVDKRLVGRPQPETREAPGNSSRR
jgi:hypothetical protein